MKNSQVTLVSAAFKYSLCSAVITHVRVVTGTVFIYQPVRFSIYCFFLTVFRIEKEYLSRNTELQPTTRYCTPISLLICMCLNINY